MSFDFKQFYEILKSLFIKKRVDFLINEHNFSIFLLNRYLSFYHPNFVVFINAISNKNGLFNNLDLDDIYEYMYAVIPEVPYKFIKYYKKESSKITCDGKIDNEQLLTCADYFEISKREILDYLYTQHELEKQ